MNSVLQAELDRLIEREQSLFQMLDGTSILLTGATGLIGSWIAMACLRYNERKQGKIRLLLLARNREKLEKILCNFPSQESFLLLQDVTEPIPMGQPIDFIIHTASQTSSKLFVQKPVETIRTALKGTENMLELSRQKKMKAMVYLSSLEVYGQYGADLYEIREDDFGGLDPINIRSSYPESKRMAESLCAAYASEQNAEVKIARLTQTFGPGISYHDSRVFAEFARCAVEGKDIILHTKGETIRNYCHIADAVSGILYVLLYGKRGEAYNVAGRDTRLSIYEMACMTAKLAGNSIQVQIKNDATQAMGYNPVMKVYLNTEKLEQFGWRPFYTMQELLEQTIAYMREEA